MPHFKLNTKVERASITITQLGKHMIVIPRWIGGWGVVDWVEEVLHLSGGGLL
jgi:hypothetical protein